MGWGHTRQTLLKGNTAHLTSYYFRLAAIHIENIIYLCYKTSYLNEEINLTKLSLWLVFPEAKFLVICEWLMTELSTSCERDKYELFWYSQYSAKYLKTSYELDRHELCGTII